MDEHLRALERRWLATNDPQDLAALDVEAQRSGVFGPSLATAINNCIQIAGTVVLDASYVSVYTDFNEVQQDWDLRRIPAYKVSAHLPNSSKLVEGPCRIELVIKSLLSGPRCTWQGSWTQENSQGYPFFYEFSYILDVIIHATKHGLRYTPEEQAAIATALIGFLGGESLLCNLRHYHRRHGQAVLPCVKNVLECDRDDCDCEYGRRALNVCRACKRRRTACVCDQFHHIQVGTAFGGPVVIELHPEVDLCSCHGSGWTHSDYDSAHQCQYHYTNQPHPDSLGEDYDEFLGPPRPPLVPPYIPPPHDPNAPDDLPF